MATLDVRVTKLEEQVDNMEADAKVHFAELQQCIAEQVTGLERRLGRKINRKINWVIAIALAGMLISLATFLVTIR
jgi:hypothetical protein